MKARVILTTVISFLLLCAVVAAGLNAVFTVTSVKAEFSVSSEDGEREAAELKQKLDGFVGKSSTFLDEEEVAALIASYPCMKAEKIQKHYPSTLEVSVSERKEAFSVLTEHGYAVLSDDGTYLYTKQDLTNRAGGENILLSGLDLSLAEGQKTDDKALNEILTVYGVFAEILTEARANVVSIAYEPNLAFENILVIQMREGIRIEIATSSALTEEKARAALNDESDGYLARSDGERLCGCIRVTASAENVVRVAYDASLN